MENTCLKRDDALPEEQSLRVSLGQLRAAVEQKDERIQALEHQLNWFKRQLFGEKSECNKGDRFIIRWYRVVRAWLRR